uniref:EF-hand domain-containing protein n=1 Tax=Alexandrium monilatum TaxID=311494 RepID=A0A7S4RS37_9DINO
MGKQGRKKKRGSTLADKIESRRLRYNNQRLERAILTFFAACDEDDSGFLEAHEFVIAQAVIAEMAGNAFDDDAANDMFADVRKFDKSGDNLVSPKEFKQTMMEMCEVIPRNAEEIIQELAQRTATVAMQMRREVVMVLRKFFKALDLDHSGYLDQDEMVMLVDITKECAKQTLGEQAEEFFSLERFDTSRDGKVELEEFVDHLLTWAKGMKVPKRDILARIKDYEVQAAAAPRS